jgi:hypothetical protein
MPRSVASRPLSILALTLAGCGSATPRSELAGSERTPDASEPGDATTTAPCVGDPRCQVLARTAAGTDAAGVALFVIETSRGARSVVTGEPIEEPSDDAEVASDDAEVASEPTCELHEYHLERAGRFERVLSLCNDGYGAAGVGEDTVTIDTNRLVHEQYDGSSWRWATHTEEQLVPRRLLRATSSGHWTLGPNSEDRSFDVDAFTGLVSWYSPVCGSEQEENIESDVPEGQLRAYVIVPSVALDPRFDPATTRVTSCGTRVDATEASSLLLSGTRGQADDAWLEVVATREHEVIVLVHDDHFVAGDQLAVHVGPSASGYMDHCLEPTNEHVSVVFEASSGAVLEGDAAAIGARTGSAPDGRFVRFTVPEHGAVTVAYTDADERGVERTFSTSALREGDTHSLGAIGTALDGLEISCSIEEGALVRVIHDRAASSSWAEE